MNLQGVLDAVILQRVMELTRIRFASTVQFKTAEALILYEQRILDDDSLLAMCQEYYDEVLQQPVCTYVPSSIQEQFRGMDVIVVSYIVQTSTVVLGTLPELKDDIILPITKQFTCDMIYVPIYTYVNIYTRQQGRPKFLYDLPPVDKLTLILEEALRLGAQDITLSNYATGAAVYYNARKHRVDSKRVVTRHDVELLINDMATQANATFANAGRIPRYFSIDLDKHNRGRVVVNHTYYGFMATIRILPNSLLTTTLEELNIERNACDFIRNTFLSKEKGLRLLIGETFSGKNTTILAALREKVLENEYKIVSVEQPVEILVDGIEQIDTETDEEFALNADSLLRQNPDIVYFTEITQRTAESILKQSNTSKAVYSSVHANSVADVVSRLCDITQADPNRIISTLQCCIYQQLIRDDARDAIFPVDVCVYFSQELKNKLYNKQLHEIYAILKEEEEKWKNFTGADYSGLV